MDNLHTNLQAVFDSYSQAGVMDGRSFAKVTKDCKGLLDSKKLTPADVDLVFAKVKKSPIERKIGFQEFLMAVEIMAQKKGVSGEEIGLMITMSC